MLAGGFINDRLGPKLVVIAGGVMIGLGYIICGFLIFIEHALYRLRSLCRYWYRNG